MPAVAAPSSKVGAPSAPVVAKALPRQNQVQGRVIFVSQVEQQPEDFDIYLFLTRCLWSVLLVLSPLLLVCALFVTVGLLVGLVATVGCAYFAFWLFTKNPFAFIQAAFMVIQSGLMLALFRRSSVATQPVRTVRIRDKVQKREVSVWIKGHFSSGDILVDDEVTIWGRWRDGNFVFARGVNQRTSSHITLRFSKSKLLFWVTLFFVVWIGFAIYHSGGPLLQQLKEWSCWLRR